MSEEPVKELSEREALLAQLKDDLAEEEYLLRIDPTPPVVDYFKKSDA